MQALRSVTAGLSQHTKVTGLGLEIKKHKRPCENYVHPPIQLFYRGYDIYQNE